MKQIIVSFSQKDSLANKLNAKLSFQPFVEYIESKLSDDKTVKQKVFKLVHDRLHEFSSLTNKISIEEAVECPEMLELIYAALTGISTEQDEELWAIGTPVPMKIFYGTDALYDLLIDKETKELNVSIGHDAVKNEKRKTLMLYSMILKRCYNFTLPFKNDIIHYHHDPATGLSKFFLIFLDDRFIKISTEMTLPALNFRKLEKDYRNFTITDYLQKVLPPELFTFTGFSIIHMVDVTVHHAIENIKNSIIDTATKPKELCVAEIVHSLKTLIGCKGIEFGFIPYASLNNKPLLEFSTLSNSVLLHYGRGLAIPEDTFTKLVDDYIKDPAPVFLKDISRYKTMSNPLITILKKSGNISFALIPLFYNDQLTGVMEVYTNKPDLLDENKIKKLNEALPYLAQLLKANVDDFQQKIAHIVNEKFTAIQPSVRWKFNEAAWHYMYNRFSLKKEPTVETIVFKKVFPLYGAIDIRNSSIERNNAAREDHIRNMELLVQTITKLKEKRPLGLMDEMIYKVKKWERSLHESLTPAEEYRLNIFLDNEVTPFLQHMKKINPSSSSIVDTYLGSLNEETGIVFEKRRNLEKAMQLINSTISDHFDVAKTELQQSYPCYFEKFRTDGIEYDIYIGQSMAPDIPFDIIYLKNLRLWQLKSMAAIYKMILALEPSMPKLLSVTQLIYINADPIDISFRADEKRFDVEGTYNIRYQVIKKRIDKVHIKGTEERLTQTGKIALVYFNNREADEYVSYINFLQEQNILDNNLEFLELEELQGVHGLKALRIGIATD